MNEEINSFLTYIRRSQNKKQNTLNSYRRDLEMFGNYLKGKYNIQIKDARKTHILTFLLDMQKDARNSSTISRYLSSIKTYCRYLVREGIIEKNPASDVKSPRVEKKIPEYLTIKEIIELLSLPDENTLLGYRDKTILETLYSTGMQVSEIIGLSLKDYNRQSGCIDIKSVESPRIIPLGSAASLCINEYIDNYRKLLASKTPRETAIFVNSSGKRLTRQGIWKILRKYFDMMNINKNVTPQVIRNTVVKHLLDNGADAAAICRLLGTDKIYALDFYSSSKNDNPSDLMKKFHPRA